MKRLIGNWSNIEHKVILNLAGAGGRAIPVRPGLKNDGRPSVGIRKESPKHAPETYLTGRLNGLGHSLFLFLTCWTVPKSVLVSAGILVVAGIWFIIFGSMSEPTIDLAASNAANTPFMQKAARSGYLAKWQRFKRGSEQTIKANEYRIVAFRVKMDEAGPRFKARYANKVGLLEQKNLALKKKLEAYPDEGQDRWEEFRTNFNGEIEGVGESMTALFKDDN